MRILKLYLLFSLLFCVAGFAQDMEKTPTDSINVQEHTYEALEKAYMSNAQDSAKALVPARKYLLKAKKENDIIKIADGYHMLFQINSSDTIGLKYADSIISITKNTDDKDYPAKGYIAIGRYYYNKGNYKEAFDNKLMALPYASKQNNLFQLLHIKHFLAVIKKRLGEDKEALALFKERLSLLQKHNVDGEYDRDLMLAFMSISDSYRRNKSLDTAMAMAKKGIDMSLAADNERYYRICLLSSGLILHDKENYMTAIDSLKKANEFFEISAEKTNLAISYLYLGKSYDQLQKQEVTIGYLKKLDSILLKYPKLVFEFREGYEYLIDHYKSAGDKDQQLYYVERLLYIDSILDNTYRYLTKSMVQKYDTPTLMAEKKQLITLLYRQNRLSFSGIIALGILLLIAFAFAYHYYRKQRILKERFNKVMSESNESEKTAVVTTTESKNEDIGISKEIVKNILDGLSKFIEKQGYLSQKINLHNLAKKLQTNPKYLSKTINFYEQKSFTSYINDLRINYVIEQLKIDKKLRQYAIKGIADEIGFNNQQSFSQAFHKKTGMHPSYFIKQLQKQA